MANTEADDIVLAAMLVAGDIRDLLRALDVLDVERAAGVRRRLLEVITASDLNAAMRARASS